MNGFAQKVTDAISNLKSSPEYEPGKEVAILVPVENKSATLKGIPLDEAKISYIEGPRRITYNNFILENSYVWSGNVPSDIQVKLLYLE